MTQHFIKNLVKAYPSIREIWLFGSRANGRERPDSDWDYLAFGDDVRVLNTLAQTPHFKEDGIDLLFAASDDMAACPWPEDDGYRKILGLGAAPGGMNWCVLSDIDATYIETKNRSPGSFEVDIRRARARCVYRRK